MSSTTDSSTRTYVIDKSHSEVFFQVRHLVTKVRGLGLPVTSIIPGDRPRPGLADKAIDTTGNAYHSASRGSGHEDS